jgi:UDP-N-acetylglucosamine 4,6-dehydratase
MFLLTLGRNKKRALLVGADMFLVALSLWLAFTLRLGVWFWPNPGQIWLFICAPILALPVFNIFGFYNSIVRYMGNKAKLEILKATGLLVLLWVLVVTTILPLYLKLEITFPQFLSDVNKFPRSVPFLFWILLLLTVGGSRQVIIWVLFASNTKYTNKPTRNILIYGAGKGGVELALSLSQNSDIKVIGFIDDNKTFKGLYIQDLKILGDRTEIEKIRRKVIPLEILLAVPNMEIKKRKNLIRYLEDKKVAVRTVPSLNSIASGRAKISDLQAVDIIDLLGREPIDPNHKLLSSCITNKVVMITGAGGSIGSELCRQILALNPLCVVLLEHSEHNLYSINMELTNLRNKFNSNADIIPNLGSVTNEKLVEDIIKNFNVNTIYHAAAYKHVALLENNIWEGVQNNVFGTYCVARAALNLGVENFILISTDKAVRPSSVMGATKRIAELITQGFSQKQETKSKYEKKVTRFVIVRFGNVLGSSGSVIPLFKKQIAAGGPVTITHPEVTRYFMTIQEASELVLQASSMGNNCNVFILNMGEPVSILNLAKQMIYLSGHILKTDETQTDNSCIEIEFTQLQKGEKIHEELFIGENITSTQHPMIMEVQEEFCSWSEIEEILTELKSKCTSEQNSLRQILVDYAWKNKAEKSIDPKKNK